MFGLGVPELIFILLLALLIFGPKKLPEIGRTLGKGMAEFRKASNELTRTINAELALDETPTPPTIRAVQAPESQARTPLIAAVPDPVPVASETPAPAAQEASVAASAAAVEPAGAAAGPSEPPASGSGLG